MNNLKGQATNGDESGSTHPAGATGRNHANDERGGNDADEEASKTCR